jgi:hypothetical protein
MGFGLAFQGAGEADQELYDNPVNRDRAAAEIVSVWPLRTARRA